jgi:hypothetical protein
MQSDSSEARQKPGSRLHLEQKLEVGTEIFSAEVVLQLVNDWIVPVLVDEFLRSRMNLPEFA